MPREPKARPEALLKVGKVASAHGLAGGLNIYSYTHPPARIFSYQPWLIGTGPADVRPFTLANARMLPRRIVAFLREVRDRNTAEAMKGLWIFIAREQVPREAGEFLWDELVGCRVRSEDGQVLGEVVRVVDFGAQDILVVDGQDAQGRRGEWMIPFTEAVVRAVRPHEEIVITMLEGLDACFTPRW